MAVIKVPKPPKNAYDSRRPAGDLLKKQLEHLEWAVRPASQRRPDQLKLMMPKTEGDAAARIATLTKQLHQVSAVAPGTLPAQAPAADQARAAEKEKVAKRRRKARRARKRGR
jgi:hypothetical protein